MRSIDCVGDALTLWRGIRRRMTARLTVTARCNECGATRLVQSGLGDVYESGTMMHQPWCSLEIDAITHSVQRVRL
jgi:hypothetical protein